MFRVPDVNPHEDRDREKRLEAVHRHHRILDAGLLLLALALAGGVWYAYQALQRHELALRQVPGMQKLADTIGNQLKQDDQKLASWADDQRSLRYRIVRLGEAMETKIAGVARQAQVSSAETYRRVEAEIDERLQGVNARLTHIESSNEIQEARIAELQRELEEVRRHAAKQADDPSTGQSNTEGDGATH